MIDSTVLVATGRDVFRVTGGEVPAAKGSGLGDARPTSLAADPVDPGRVWCGSDGHGVFRSDDAGRTWGVVGLEGVRIMSLATGPAGSGRLWAGTEPSRVLRSDDRGESWRETSDLTALPSSSGWAFPPRPETHHVRWIAPDPGDPDGLWVAVEAGALIRTTDGGATWRDRTPGGPRDTHELAVHPDRPRVLRVAAGDGYFESEDGGDTWRSPEEGLEVGYLRSVAVDPGDVETVLVSAASAPRSAYVAGRSDGRLYRKEGAGEWGRVLEGWPEPASGIAPLLRPGLRDGELWAADERGVHTSGDGGRRWWTRSRFPSTPDNLRGLVVLPGV